MWVQIKDLINDSTIDSIVTDLGNRLPDGAVAFRVLVQQTLGSGLTMLILIRDTMLAYPSFPWNILAGFMGGEMKCAVDAMNLVGDNQYLGYIKELGIAASSYYRGLAWTCLPGICVNQLTSKL